MTFLQSKKHSLKKFTVENSKLAQAYTKFRGSKIFLVGLISFICIWVTIHFLMGTDKDWGALNTILSSEASIALAFFTMMADKQDHFQQKQLEYMQHLLEAQYSLIQTRIEDSKKRETINGD